MNLELISNKIRDVMTIVPALKEKFQMERNSDGCDTLLFSGVAKSNIIAALAPLVEAKFGKPYKPAGEGAFLKNWFDAFVKDVGGVRFEQTLYRLDLGDDIGMYCAFWPWGSDPERTSIRIGILCPDDEAESQIDRQVGKLFW